MIGVDGGLKRTANLLGAVALTSADRVRETTAEAAGTSTSGAAALVTLETYSGLGVTELGKRIGLSQPAAARMVDALVGQGLVERRRASGRSVGVWLTRRGRTAVARMLNARNRALVRLVQDLEPEQQDALRAGLEALLPGVFERATSEHVVCRLCDRDACVADGSVCPVGQAARNHERARAE